MLDPFEEMNQQLDAMRDKLVDGGIKQVETGELAVMFYKSTQMIDALEEISLRGTQLTEAITAIGKAINAECERREHKQPTRGEK
ncbi:hypothetical protein Enr13x_28030 [Stieleria neptunia]|uniref:Uncharacterized protein n=1 Tax=Stieleria neptunia TaxID=2527979 RepID=A0A518HQ51_9BACT|nr:hypothetical protein [Stieleria neptunia]QDV42951.1 hypothetical protein Enr13x_28030 [Stieleria neptunia]